MIQAGNLIIPANAVIRGTNADWKSQEVAQTSVNLQREIVSWSACWTWVISVYAAFTTTIRPTSIRLRRNRRAWTIIWQGHWLNNIPSWETSPCSFPTLQVWYDALTARLVAQLNNGITVSASYAHGRNFANGNNIDQTNLYQYYGPTQQDIAHTFSAQFTYEFPLGHGKRFLGNANRLVDALLGGWQYSGFLTIRSGLRFNIASEVSLLNNGQSNRSNRICNGNLSDPTVNAWFDTSCFVDVLVPDTYGNTGINPLHTDALQQLDSSLFKTFKLTERMNLQFRADAFNTFNHPNFAAPDATVGDPSAGQVFSTSVDNQPDAIWIAPFLLKSRFI